MSAQQERIRVTRFFKDEAKKLVSYVKKQLADIAAEDAEDIVQDVMLGIFDRADVTAPIQNLSAYIYRSLYNRVVDRYRQRDKKVRSLDEYMDHEGEHTLADILADVRFDVHDEYEKRMIWNELFRAIETLKPSYREIFVQTEFEGRTFKELAARTGVPVGTLLSKKHRAVKQIRSALAHIYDTKGA
ncbi:MAG: RNA polymerase sigma factor [Spirochaetes bacterium]|nr:RNA polymerase sigma factor [Spirochaetota bacterium]